MKKKPIFNLDKEEQELSNSFDKGEWVSVRNLSREKKKAKKASDNYREKDAAGHLDR